MEKLVRGNLRDICAISKGFRLVVANRLEAYNVKMTYSKDYFDLQIQFAKVIAHLKTKPMEEILLNYTSFYKTFKIEGWDFDQNNTTWQVYLTRIRTASDLVEETFNFYLEQVQQKPQSEENSPFGCFSYEFEEKDNAIQIHFANRDAAEPGALSKERMVQRSKELKMMFRQIKELYPNVKEVWGFSWLYNIEAYTRLFPPEYIASKKEINKWFKSSALWGQFLDSGGNFKKELAEKFLECLEGKKESADKDSAIFADCFKYKVQELVAPIEVFDSFYKV